ncbi:hypothetical protein EX30DRAFT_300967 [Ascodesmis nigricans]|uniref:CREG-like beta-barrel domain-containing protein n=1 Tax=Ascodesmis nigricans TaxID=341454 RepID=A0A4S2N5P5_9PEZI|nr:hypothetical protein EX30DRAFT_300967 [Ascodesmis nigricans]
MRFLPAIVGLLPLVSAYYHDFPDTEFEPEPFHVVDLETASRPTIEQAAVQARRVVRREKIGTLSTVFQNGAPDGLEGSPIALMDYYADCSDDGSPALLGFKIAMNFRNVEQGSAISLSIRQHKPMGEFFSPAAHHRLSLIGKLEKVDADSDEAEELKKCYIRRHPDAKWWTPGNKIHDSYWVKFKVEKVYWIGGFGNVQQIGCIITFTISLPFIILTQL